MQKSIDLLMSRISFQRIIKKIMKNEKRTRESHMQDLRIQKNALDVLQNVIKDFMIETFESQFYYSLNNVNFVLCIQ